VTALLELLDLGVPPHVVRDVVGHSALDVTMNIYAHVSLDEKWTALGKLAERLS
jgi:integrase